MIDVYLNPDKSKKKSVIIDCLDWHILFSYIVFSSVLFWNISKTGYFVATDLIGLVFGKYQVIYKNSNRYN